jgi:hypothetical protein
MLAPGATHTHTHGWCAHTHTHTARRMGHDERRLGHTHARTRSLHTHRLLLPRAAATARNNTTAPACSDSRQHTRSRAPTPPLATQLVRAMLCTASAPPPPLNETDAHAHGTSAGLGRMRVGGKLCPSTAVCCVPGQVAPARHAHHRAAATAGCARPAASSEHPAAQRRPSCVSRPPARPQQRLHAARAAQHDGKRMSRRRCPSRQQACLLGHRLTGSGCAAAGRSRAGSAHTCCTTPCPATPATPATPACPATRLCRAHESPSLSSLGACTHTRAHARTHTRVNNSQRLRTLRPNKILCQLL